MPYTDNTDYEGYYQQVLYIIFTLTGYYVDVEAHTSKGRIDVVMRTAHINYSCPKGLPYRQRFINFASNPINNTHEIFRP